MEHCGLFQVHSSVPGPDLVFGSAEETDADAACLALYLVPCLILGEMAYGHT